MDYDIPYYHILSENTNISNLQQNTCYNIINQFCFSAFIALIYPIIEAINNILSKITPKIDFTYVLYATHKIPTGIPTVYQQPQQKPIITQKPAEKPLTQEQILQQQQQQMLQQQQLIQGKTIEQTSDRNLLNNNQSNNINNK